jgi:hypothetical protein
MKKITNIILIFSLLVLSNNAKAQNDPFDPARRTVFWTHGIEGDVQSMKALRDYFAANYKINSIHNSYPSNRGFSYAANQVAGWIIGTQRTDDIAVAHSMGGVVMRQFYKDYPNRRFGGLITIDSPHLGAEFASSFDNGKIVQFFNRVKDDGTAGYQIMGSAVGNINEFHSNLLDMANRYGMARDKIDQYNLWSNVSATAGNFLFSIVGFKLAGTYGAVTGGLAGWLVGKWIVNLFTANSIQKEVHDIMDKFLIDIMNKAALYVFGSPDPSFEYSKNDLKPTSTAINALKASPMSCPRIAIGGVAKYPAGLSFLGSSLYYLQQDIKPGIGGVTDNLVIEMVDGIAADARKCRSEYSFLYSLNSWLLLGITNSYYRERRDAFDRQARFWEDGLERAYQQCLGSIYYEQVSETVQVWVSGCNDNVSVASMPIMEPEYALKSKYINPCEGYWDYQTITYSVERIHPNDGIVVLPSQHGLAGATIHTVQGTNHEQAKRSVGVKDYLEEQFNSHPFFKIPRK